MDRNYAEKPYPPPNPEVVGYGQPYQSPPGYMPVPQGPPGPPGMPQQAGYPPPLGPPPQGVHYSQQYPNTVVVQQPVVIAGPPPGPEPPSQLGCAIFVCLCCFWPTGLIAICKARDARSAWESGDAARAYANTSTARKLIIASVVLGIICIIVTIVVQLLKKRLREEHTNDYDY